MLPRTFLSQRFRYQRHSEPRFEGGLFDGFSGAVYWRPPAGSNDNPYADAYIPPGYDERLILCDGMWDDGEHLVVITWLDVVVYPSWDIVATWWDRTAGQQRDRRGINFSFMPDGGGTSTLDILQKRHSFNVDDPNTEALGTEIIPRLRDSSPLRPYIRGFSRAADGTIWASQDGSVQALTRIRMQTATPEYNARKPTSLKYAPGLTPEQEVEAAVEWAKGESAKDFLGREIGTAEVKVLYWDFPRQTPPGFVNITSEPGVPEYRPPPVNPTESELEQVLLTMGPDEYYRRAEEKSSTRVLEVRLGSREGFSYFDPGTVDNLESIRFLEMGMYYLTAFLVITERVVLVCPVGSRGGNIPAVAHSIAWVGAGHALTHADGTPYLTIAPTLLGLFLLPAQPVALAFGEDKHVWALLADNTVVCVRRDTGEPLAYAWIPLPYEVSGVAVSCKITYQKDYRRLLVFGLLPSNRILTDVRNRWNSRIVGYSTTPIAVHVCRPIPLRPVRAGRATPFWVRQVGGLCEPVAGVITMTGGAGVTFDRATVPLDDSGEGVVRVTVDAAGTASVTASSTVEATWDAPAVPGPWGNTEPWIEGAA